MTGYTIKNWEVYQHYKDRRPPWIKLHRSILDDQKFMSLSDASKGLLLQLWILASEHDGLVPGTPDEIAWRLRKTTINLDPLITSGFIVDASGCKQMQAAVVPETETETETEKNIAFAEFWIHYPKKTNKTEAQKSWKKLGRVDQQLALSVLPQQIKLWTDPKFIPYASTWLNQKRFQDEFGAPEEVKGCNGCGVSGMTKDGAWCKCEWGQEQKELYG